MSIYLFVKCYGVAIENGAFDAVFSDNSITIKDGIFGQEINTADEQRAYPLDKVFRATTNLRVTSKLNCNGRLPIPYALKISTPLYVEEVFFF